MDESLVNAIMLDPPYVVTREAEPDAVWMEGLEGTQAISLDEALEIMADQASTAALDGWLTPEQVEEFFE